MMRYLRIFGILPFFISFITHPLHAQQTINVAPDGVNDVPAISIHPFLINIIQLLSINSFIDFPQIIRNFAS